MSDKRKQPFTPRIGGSRCYDAVTLDECEEYRKMCKDYRTDNHELILTNMAQLDEQQKELVEQNQKDIKTINQKLDVISDTITPILKGIHSVEEGFNALSPIFESAKWIMKWVVLPVTGLIITIQGYLHIGKH